MRDTAIVVSLITLAMPPHIWWVDLLLLANALFCIFWSRE